MPIQATRLETDEDVRRALALHRPGARAAAMPVNGGPAPADDGPPLFRPSLRPATPVLTIYDDSAESGESVRIRKDQFVIGRTEGDLVIPHDGQMSSRHAAIQQKTSKDNVRWTLVDLKSTNGTFVRVSQALLEDGAEFIVGRTRLKFERSPNSAGPPKATSPAEQATQLWQNQTPNDASPALVELSADGKGRRLLLNTHETWLGKDPGHCQFVLSADPFVSARHARVRLDEEGRWVLENNKSINGVWLKVEQIAFKGSCRFMLGEQRFCVQLP
jgi:pSer/pThr/pTyr-binding forkhead associated (FHA) protein